MFIQFLRRLSVRRRIVGSFAILLAFLMLSIPLIVANNLALTNRVQQLVEVDARSDRLLLSALTRILSSRVNLMRYAEDLTPSPSDALTDVKEAIRLIEEARTLIEEPEQKTATANILAGLVSYSTLITDVHNARLQNRPQDVETLLSNSYQLEFILEQQVRSVVSRNEANVDRANQTALDDAQRRLSILITGYVILLGIAIVMAFIVQQSISRPIADLRRSAEAFLSERKTMEIPAEGTDELSILARTFNQITAELSQTLTGLEQRVEARTAELRATSEQNEKRARQLQTISEISRAISNQTGLEKLLPLITHVVSDRFGFYHTGIFLLDDRNEYAVLVAANSEGGTRMIERGHKLKVGQVGIVGYAAGSGNARIALDTGHDAVYFNNPDLPETHSEMALPLKSGGRVIGILDVQSIEESAFSNEDIASLSILADQISIAIESTRQYEATLKSLERTEATYRQYVQREWSRLAAEEKLAGYRYYAGTSSRLDQPLELGEIGSTVAEGRIYQQESETTDMAAQLAVPVKLRGEVIGVLSISSPTKKRWADDDIDIAEAVAERLALAIENARLFQVTTNRAERERIVSDIASKISGNIRIEGLLRTAAQELSQAISGSEVLIQLQSVKQFGGPQ